MTRHISSLCQNCYSDQRPDRYFPETYRTGTCCGCGDLTFVARVSRGEAQQVQYLLFAEYDDRPACCRVPASQAH